MAPALALLLIMSQSPTIPSGGTELVNQSALALQGDAAYGTIEKVSVSGQPFTQALRVTTLRQAPSEWMFEVGADATGAIKKGEVLFASVFVRVIKGQPETGEGRTTLDFQRKGGDWSKFVSHPIPVTKDWRRIDVPFVALYDTEAGASNIAFRLGYGPQVIEIGGLSVRNFHQEISVDKLPKTAITYRGQEANAPWRKAAEARIEKIRKGDAAVVVTDSSGKPMAGATVEAKMTRHAFPFGTAVAADELFVEGPDGDKYREILLAHFNRATIENNLKWPFWEDWGRKDGIAAVDWLNAHNISIRAHNVVWPSWRNSPKDLADLSNDALRKRIDDHIREEVTTLKGKVDLWDVINEPFDNHEVMDKLGEDEMVSWFRQVKAIDDKPLLVLNDYAPLDGAATHSDHLNSFYRHIEQLQQKGAPIEGIGFQAHIGGDPIPPERVLSGLDRFSKFGLPIEITEFDINTQDREFQTNYTRDFLTAIFSHPAVAGFTQWGFWSKRHWLPDGAIYGPDWSLRPHGKAYFDLVEKTWWTDARGKTDASGRFNFRGFYGDYDIIVGGRKISSISLRPSEKKLSVTVKS
jgi:GH35 family endo-1,4-beta-xylanase